jgi:catechol 2,3-dioxygenase-like lactoylglutathione lyase family enzyme
MLLAPGGEIMPVPSNTRVTAVTLNSPAPSTLARFYARLLGWEVTVDKGGWVQLPNPGGGIGLSFHIDDAYERPVWPSEHGKQQMQVHLEVQVDDLEEGAAHAQACGATLADYQPQDDVRVHLDPDGHPFCVYV